MSKRESDLAKREPGLMRYVLYTGAVVVATAGVLFAWHQVDQFLIRDPRFVLAAVDGDSESALQIEGARHSSREQIARMFQPDVGRSVYLAPLAERRRNLLAVEWVKDANVSRIWPRQIAVRIIERQPVAFVRLPRKQDAVLVDEDGVFLELRNSARFRLPVVTGLSEEQTEPERKARVWRLLKMQAEIGAHIDRLSEIDLADPDNVKVTYPIGERAMVLYLGYNHYARRLKKFLDNYDEVRKRLPEARVLDLRLEDRITSVTGEPAEPIMEPGDGQ